MASDPLPQVIQSLHEHNYSCVRMSAFSLGVAPHQGCPLPLVLYLICIDRISRRTQGRECVPLCGPQDCLNMIYEHNVFFLVSLVDDFQHTHKVLTKISHG